MKSNHWQFFGGVLVGSLAIILLCAAAIVGGLVTYFIVEKQEFFSGTTTRTIDARQGWQSTGLQIKSGTRINIEVKNGQWTNWSGTQPLNSGEGGNYVCAGAMRASQCVEPIPEFPQGGLIGKVGSQKFGIGKNVSLITEQSGILWLRINDADIGLYDNDGELVVEIAVER